MRFFKTMPFAMNKLHLSAYNRTPSGTLAVQFVHSKAFFLSTNISNGKVEFFSTFPFNYLFQFVIFEKSGAFNDAPPIRPPSMFGFDKSSTAFPAFMLPPY